MIIDIHAHTSSHKMWGLHTDDASIEKLKAEAWRMGVSRTVLLATYFPFKGTGLSNVELLRRIQGEELFLAFGSLDVMNYLDEGVAELEQLAFNRLIRGIKLYPGYQVFNPSDINLDDVYDLAQMFDLPVMFHGGELHHCCPSEQRAAGGFKCKHDPCPINLYQHLSHPDRLRPMLKRYGDVKFIVSHLANPYFEALRGLMAEFDNVYTDISGQFVSGNHNSDEDTPENRQQIVDQIKRFCDLPRGVERILFGTDFPIQSYDDSVWLVENLGLTPVERAKIYWHNAGSVLGFSD